MQFVQEFSMDLKNILEKNKNCNFDDAEYRERTEYSAYSTFDLVEQATTVFET